ncbi:MAG TPA: aromatic amino acid ammonia-lyase [Caulobacteraceae bacterium]|jgi:histidine ammonia-lyase|nr:aromatic amino acid ammonia-lyase [Caulobacteraceae bacterium]
MRRRLPVLAAALALLAAGPALAARPAPAYAPIQPTAAAQARTIVLNGHDLTVDDVMAVARDGAKVRFSPAAIAQAEAGRGLLAQGNAEGLAIYGVNRGAGALREVQTQRTQQAESGRTGDGGGARFGALPEIDEEALVRAFLVIQANHIPYNAATADYMTMICELLNRRVTPVMYARGSIGEGDLMLTSNFQATMGGRGDAYFAGQRMPAAQALQRAGLQPLQGPTGGGTTNAYATALALMLVDEGREALEWADLTLAIDLTAMNSSVTPLTPIVQARRPFAWVNWEADKLLGILRGGYLMQDDAHRVLQDPESLRAAHIRLGSTWQAWADLRDAVTIQMNSGEQNPVIVLDAKPTDAWVLATPWVAKYHVNGGPLSNGRSGYVLSNANWDPYPMTNEVEAFNLAFANMAVTVANRIERFSDRTPTPFFTGVNPSEVMSAEDKRLAPYEAEAFFTYLDVWKELQTLTQSVPPDSSSSDNGVADLEAMSRLKAARGRQAVDLFVQLMGYDLTAATYWLDVRRIQDPKREFGQPVTAAWTALRKVLPWRQEPSQRADLPFGVIAYDFIAAHPARTFTGSPPPMPATLPLPAAR